MLDIGFLKALGVDLPNRIAPAIDEASSQTVLLQIFKHAKCGPEQRDAKCHFPNLFCTDHNRSQPLAVGLRIQHDSDTSRAGQGALVGRAEPISAPR
jgi:hypothetical protein